MADAVTSQTIFSGNRVLVKRFTNVSDGSGESGATKVDISALLLADGRAPTSVVIDRIDYNSFGMAVKVIVDHSTDVVLAVLQGFGSIDVRKAGGIQTHGTGDTGDILFTTVGHTSGDTYDITLWMRLKA